MRKLITVILCLTVVLLGGYASFRGYKVWKQRHMMTLAKEYLAKADGGNTVLCLKQVLQSNPQNLEAVRLMAQVCEAARSPSALLWRSRVMELNPRSLDDRLAVVQTAMAVRDLTTATNALQGVDQAGRQTPAFHQAAASIALATGNYNDAEFHLKEVVRLKPLDPVPQLNLSVLHLRSTNTHSVAEARAILNVLCLNPTNAALRCQAFRELTVDAMVHKESEAAAKLSKQLLDETNSVFSDRLLQLAVLQGGQRPEFKPNLASCQREATGDPQKTYELASWQMREMSPADALGWMKTLPAAVQTNQPVALMSAECREAMHDWQGLESTLSKQQWAELEFMRLALRTRALRSLEMSSVAKLEWDQAQKFANGQKQSLITLLRMAAQWGWASDVEEILGTISSRYPSEKWAGQALMQSYLANGQTRSLMAIFSKEVQKSPASLESKNNLAMLALLLDARELKPYEMAREVYLGSPTNSSYASTYALSLYLQKKNAEALKVLEALKPSDLEDPSLAGYYGLVLQAMGNKAKARKYFELSDKARFLPEERKLMERARASL